MGINLSFLPFFDLCDKEKALTEPLVVLGAQEMHDPNYVISEFARERSYAHLISQSSVSCLFRDRYGISTYTDFDINDRAAVKVDLNQPIDPVLARSAMTVLDAGTIEHVFDIKQVFKNIHDLVRPNGVIIHIAPVSWHEHGYYNFNPRLFTAVRQANHYTLIAEAFHLPCDAMSGGTTAKPSLYVTFDGKGDTPLADQVRQMFAGGSIPSRALYMVAHRKTGDGVFVYPYDIQ